MVDGCSTRAEFDTLVQSRKKSVCPELLAANGVPFRIAQHDVGRQVLILRAQCIADPRAHHRPARKNIASKQHVEPFEMIVVLRVHRTHKAKIINDCAHVGQSFRDVHAALPMFLKFQRRRQEAVNIIRLMNFNAIGVRLSGETSQRWLGVEQVHLIRNAILNQFGIGREVTRASAEIVINGYFRPESRFVTQQTVSAKKIGKNHFPKSQTGKFQNSSMAKWHHKNTN